MATVTARRRREKEIAVCAAPLVLDTLTLDVWEMVGVVDDVWEMVGEEVEDTEMVGVMLDVTEMVGVMLDVTEMVRVIEEETESAGVLLADTTPSWNLKEPPNSWFVLHVPTA